jgi:hypothetical protein
MKHMLSSVGAVMVLSAVSQGQCRVGKETNEAKLLAYYAVPLAFSPSGLLERMRPGSVRAAFELTYIPKPADELRHTSICFKPKRENSQLSPVVPRPRLAVGLPGGFFVEGAYLPPITVADATPNMASVAVGVVRRLGSAIGLALRVHTTFGNVKGPITCPNDALQLSDPDAACYGTAKSRDTYRPNILGVEAALTWITQGRFAGYAGAGYARLQPRFQVGFQPSNAPFDSTRVVVNLTRVSVMLGGRLRYSRALDVTGEVYSVPKDMTTVRLGAALHIR